MWVWSDMLDPNHNDHGTYYLVQGDYTGAGSMCPKRRRLTNWCYEKRSLSLPFFPGLGFRSLARAYYDSDTLDNPALWLEQLEKTANAQGIMYTTWLNIV
jgi:hypothetical protein